MARSRWSARFLASRCAPPHSRRQNSSSCAAFLVIGDTWMTLVRVLDVKDRGTWTRRLGTGCLGASLVSLTSFGRGQRARFPRLHFPPRLAIRESSHHVLTLTATALIFREG